MLYPSSERNHARVFHSGSFSCLSLQAKGFREELFSSACKSLCNKKRQTKEKGSAPGEVPVYWEFSGNFRACMLAGFIFARIVRVFTVSGVEVSTMMPRCVSRDENLIRPLDPRATFTRNARHRRCVSNLMVQRPWTLQRSWSEPRFTLKATCVTSPNASKQCHKIIDHFCDFTPGVISDKRKDQLIGKEHQSLALVLMHHKQARKKHQTVNFGVQGQKSSVFHSVGMAT